MYHTISVYCRAHRRGRPGKCPPRAVLGGRNWVAPSHQIESGRGRRVSAQRRALGARRPAHWPPTRALPARTRWRGGRRRVARQVRASRVPLRRGARGLLANGRAATHLLDRTRMRLYKHRVQTELILVSLRWRTFTGTGAKNLLILLVHSSIREYWRKTIYHIVGSIVRSILLPCGNRLYSTLEQWSRPFRRLLQLCSSCKEVNSVHNEVLCWRLSPNVATDFLSLFHLNSCVSNWW